MNSQFNPNPANETRWFVLKSNVKYKLKVLGATFTGVRENYRTLSYEIKYDHLDQLQIIDADKFKGLINDGLVQPDYNATGSLIW